MKKMIFPAVALALIALLAIAGCGSSNSGSGGEYESSGAGRYGSGEEGAKPAAGAAAVSVGSASGVGKVLVDSRGMTLYYFEKDKQGGGKSACNGACAGVWPPLTTSGAPRATAGAEAAKLGAIKRSDGTAQVTYAGWPLYTYTVDTKPGEANGTDVKSYGGSWYPLHANGGKAGE